VDLAVVNMPKVLLVVEEVLDGGKFGSDEATESSATDCNAKADTEGSELDIALLRSSAAIL